MARAQPEQGPKRRRTKRWRRRALGVEREWKRWSQVEAQRQKKVAGEGQSSWEAGEGLGSNWEEEAVGEQKWTVAAVVGSWLKEGEEVVA